MGYCDNLALPSTACECWKVDFDDSRERDGSRLIRRLLSTMFPIFQGLCFQEKLSECTSGEEMMWRSAIQEPTNGLVLRVVFARTIEFPTSDRPVTSASAMIDHHQSVPLVDPALSRPTSIKSSQIQSSCSSNLVSCTPPISPQPYSGLDAYLLCSHSSR